MTILVTGGTRGLGKAIAERLAAGGKKVVIVARDEREGALHGDLSRLDDVRRIAREAANRYPDLEVLINNAGVSKFTREVTPDGLETTFATNYMAPFVLSNLLLPVLTRNQGRVVNIGSEQHRWVRAIPWDDLQGERRFRPIEQYSLTKLYLVLFTRQLARRAPEVTATCISPGFLRTDLGREARGTFRVFLALARPFQRSPEQGADAVIQVLEKRESGAYFRGTRQVAPGRLTQDDAAAARLWDLGVNWLQPSEVR
jgi:NAD(P)-dependent dehydrogenase (short-subunit alcohol dehydrogenase family)